MSNIILPKGYLSASQISTFLRCQKQYEFRYVEGIVSPPDIAALQGTAVHAGFESYYSEIISGNGRLPPEAVHELAMNTLVEKAEEVEFDIEPHKDTVAENVEKAIMGYIPSVAEKVTPLEVEKEIWYETPNLNVTVLGYIDLIRMKNPEEITMLTAQGEELHGDKFQGVCPETICDHKITKKKWDNKKLQSSIQFHIYTNATMIDDVEIHNVAKIEGAVKMKSRVDFNATSIDDAVDFSNNIRIIRESIGNREKIHMDNIIESVARGITSGIFIPCQLDAWCCNNTWCGYWHKCRGR